MKNRLHYDYDDVEDVTGGDNTGRETSGVDDGATESAFAT